METNSEQTKNPYREKRRPKECPICGSRKIISYEGEFFCGECDWDSDDIYARICVLANPRGNMPQGQIHHSA